MSGRKCKVVSIQEHKIYVKHTKAFEMKNKNRCTDVFCATLCPSRGHP